MWYGGELPASSFPAVNLTILEQRNLLALVSYVNAKGQEWSIPTGEYAFNIPSKSTQYPRFLSGDIDPLDVKVGDTQRMKIVVVDVAQPKQVWAEIEHDAGKDRVELKLTATKAVARGELERHPYLVNESGKLILNDTSQFSVKSIIEKLVNRAEAGSTSSLQAVGEAAYTYEGQWIVHDTHRETYRTTFVAESQVGKRDQFVMAWSDPCNFLSDGTLFDDCSYSFGTDGFDGNMNVNGKTVTLSGSAVLGFSPGRSIDVSGVGSRILIADGTSIQRAQLCITDADGDGYAPSVSPVLGGGTAGSCPGGTRTLASVAGGQTNITANLDCYDSGANASNVHPGQTQYFGIRDGRNSFDYDCNGSIAGVYTAAPNGNPSISSGYDPVYSYGTVASKEIGSCTADSFSTFVATDCGAVSSASNACAIGAAPFPQLSFLERTWNSLVPDALAIGPVRYEGFFSNSNCTNCISKDLKGYCR